MKTYRPKSNVRSSIFAHLSAVSLLATVGTVQAEDIAIQNHDFEDTQLDDDNLSLNPGENAFGWVPWLPVVQGQIQEVEGVYYGALGVNLANSSFYSELPGGVTATQVGLLYNPIESVGQGIYGMEQALGVFVSEEARIYRLSVDVGNLSTNTPEFSFDGFPEYRVQLRAGDSLIMESWHSLELEEGTWGRVVLTRRIPAGSALAGEELSIRLINENYNDLFFLSNPDGSPILESLDFTGDPEVNFDNVQLEIWPEGGDGWQHAYDGDIGYHADLGNDDDDTTDWGFTLSGKGKKRLLITGAGTSLHDRVKTLASDPFLTLTENGKAIARNDDWSRSADAREIREILAKEGVALDRSESAMLVELGAGDYTASLSTQGELGVYSGMKIYDLDPESKVKLSFGDSVQQFKDLWNGKR